jgi:hypothetical protein
MPDFWSNSGFHLLHRNGNGHLTVTDDFLGAYFMRPEVRPVPESCDAERALHAELTANPRAEVAADRIAELADADARENYQVVLDFRDRLVAAGTVEACYMALFRGGEARLPGLFVDQMAHVITRNVLDGTEEALEARAGELFFREQTVTIKDGAVMLADTETVEMYAASTGQSDLGRLIVEAGTPLKKVELDVLGEHNAVTYWDRDERHDTVLDVTFTRPGLDALCRVLEAWVAHFINARVRVQPVQKITDERWVWHLGLDAEASQLLDDLYNDVDVGSERLERLLSLFRLEFEDASLMRPDIAGRPVYMAMAMTPKKHLRLKPQNLLANLPLAPEA